MSLARLVVTAVKVEGRSKSEVARDFGVSRRWVHTLVARYETEGEAGLEPRSRRPHSSPHAVSQAVEDEIVQLRKSLAGQGLDAGAATIAVHLARSHGTAPAVATIWRILTRRGFVTPQPHKRPRSSITRFCAEQPNERWQADVTHWRLATGAEVEILNIVDDHSRLNIAADARRTTLADDVVATFRRSCGRYGIPASMLTDNGAIFTGKPRGAGRVAIEIELGLLGVRYTHSRAYHPQTCGKVERFQCATSHLVISPAQLGGTRGEVSGSDGLPVAERVSGDKSMPGNQRPGPDVRDGALGDPRDMAKAGLPEPQSPEEASSPPPERDV